jgi:3-oxoadipate enol-lactonase
MLYTANGRKVAYDLVGKPGDPVVYFAHALASDMGMWAEQVPAFLAAGFRVLRVDLRGHGGSDAAPGNYTMDDLVADAVEMLDKLEIKSAHFCGLSIGGMIGQGLGIKHGDRVKSLILCDTQSEAPKDAQTRWGPRIAQIQKANSCEPITDATLGRWLSEDFKKKHPGRWTEIRRTVAACSPQGYIGCATAIMTFKWTDQLGKIANPTYVLCGEDDPGANPEENRMIARTVQRGEFLAIPKARHLPNIEDADNFNRLIIDWCRKHG